jgi:hypothetical protein
MPITFGRGASVSCRTSLAAWSLILVGLAQLWLGMTGHTGVQNDAVFKRHQQGIPARSQQAIFSRVI